MAHAKDADGPNASAEIPALRLARARAVVAGVLLTAGSLLLVSATRRGGFG